MRTKRASHRLSERVRSAGLRVTSARVRVMAQLTASGRLLSHQDIERELGRARIDRVTLYRVLDSLVEAGLVHRVAGDDRVWRFGVMAAAPGRAELPDHGHAHFQCNACGKLVCLNGVAADFPTVHLPRGYRSEAVELTVRGRCPQCAP